MDFDQEKQTLAYSNAKCLPVVTDVQWICIERRIICYELLKCISTTPQ